MNEFDVVVVGGGPAGSTCARFLTRRGIRVAVLDAAAFPRVKLCAGWISIPVWDALEIAPGEYPLGLWEWNRCHVRYRGRDHTIDARGYFIRRYELDAWLLERCGADVVQGHRVKSIERIDGAWVVDGMYRAPLLVGAGGTHCPVARAVFPKKLEPPVGVQEHEFQAPAADVAAHRIGRDGEPELLLHQDLRGYSWNIAKTDWLNVGCGTLAAREVRDAWRDARAYFEASGHVPPSARDGLDHMAGHSYYLFHPSNLEACERDGAMLVGDALGVAQPFTAEGILPSVLSGRQCAEAITDGDPGSYRRRLREHAVFRDYATLRKLRDVDVPVPRGNGLGRSAIRVRAPEFVTHASLRAVAAGFAWMFAGKPLPAGRLLHRVVDFLPRG